MQCLTLLMQVIHWIDREWARHRRLAEVVVGVILLMGSDQHVKVVLKDVV